MRSWIQSLEDVRPVMGLLFVVDLYAVTRALMALAGVLA